MKFRTTIEIDITDNSRPSEQDVKDLMAKIIGYGSLNIKENHLFTITRTEDITAWAAARIDPSVVVIYEDNKNE